jgi:hypothetical protein
MITSNNDFTPEEIHSTDWYILPLSADGKARFKPVHDESQWARVRMRTGCYGRRALDASTPAGAWDYASAWQGGKRKETILRSSKRHTDFHDLHDAGRLLTAEEYETRRRRAIALHKLMGGQREGRSDYTEASLIAKRPIESLIQLTKAEHKRVRSVVLSARSGASEREPVRKLRSECAAAGVTDPLTWAARVVGRKESRLASYTSREIGDARRKLRHDEEHGRVGGRRLGESLQAYRQRARIS